MGEPVEPRLVLSYDGYTVLYKSKDDVFYPQWLEDNEYIAIKRLEKLTVAYSGLKMSPDDIISGLYLVSEADTNLTVFSARRLAEKCGVDHCLSLDLPPSVVKKKVHYPRKKDKLAEPKLGLSGSDLECPDISFVLEGVYYRAHVGIFYAYNRFRPERKLRAAECFRCYDDPESILKYSRRVIGVYGSAVDGLYIENRYTHRIIKKIVDGDKRRGNITHFERAR